MKRIIFATILIFLCFIKGNAQATKNKIGDSIYGDFNGDKKNEYAYRLLAKKGYGNSVEDGKADEYEIRFSDKKIKPIKVDCCWFKLINEDDLDNNGSDEITIVQSPENGCIGNVSTYSINKENSNLLFRPFSLFICADLTDLELQKLIFNDNNAIYYYQADPNDEFLLNKDGDKINFERLKKIEALKLKPIEKKKRDDVLENISNGSVSKNAISTKQRKFIFKPNPVYNCNEQGIVIVKVIVNEKGDVINVITGIKGTTNHSKCLLDACKEAAQKTKFEASDNIGKNVSINLTYNFKISD